MATIPTQGANTGTWGTDLNAYLQVEHGSDGTHGAITATSVAATGDVGAATATITGAITGASATLSGTVTADTFNIVSYENAAVFYENDIVTVT